MKDSELILQPRFLGEEGRRFFTLQFRTAAVPRAHVLFVPPFVEEMNRCRSLVAQQARALAAMGYACTLVDFFGTGDSEGDLVDARMATWRDNLAVAARHITREDDAPLVLWGLRLGGLVAMDFAARCPVAVRDILLWQPVTSGKLYITQILRQRVASLMVRELPPETTKEIRQRLADGEQVEVAGYTLAGDIVADIEALAPVMEGRLCSGAVHWLEHVSEAGKDLSVPSRKFIEQLEQAGQPVHTATFVDPPIWMIHERDEAPQLLAATREAMA